MNDVLLICHVRTARRRALGSARAEALALLHGLGAQLLPGGPLSERGGIYWLSLPEEHLTAAAARLPHFGYTWAVDCLAEPDGAELVRWHAREYGLKRLYEEHAPLLRAAAPDRRGFALPLGEEVRTVRGYRGDGGALSRRGLPVYDARLLANLAGAGPGICLLDPFAGVGGIVIEAAVRGSYVYSCDSDPFLRYGLSELSGGRHLVGDAAHLPLPDESMDAIASEPPYDASASDAVLAALDEAARVLVRGGRMAWLAAASQAEALKARGDRLGLASEHNASIDRKGTPCSLLVWSKPC